MSSSTPCAWTEDSRPRFERGVPVEVRIHFNGAWAPGFEVVDGDASQSGTSGQNPSGSVSFGLTEVGIVSGPVLCLSVTGPDRGAGTSTAPTTATFNFQSSPGTGPLGPFDFGVVKVTVVDKGGNGADLFTFEENFTGSPTDCSSLPLTFAVPISVGRAVVFDAPPCNQNDQGNQNQIGNSQGC